MTLLTAEETLFVDDKNRDHDGWESASGKRQRCCSLKVEQGVSRADVPKPLDFGFMTLFDYV
jgi:hypothetical protein